MIFFRNVKWKNLLSTGNYFTEIKLDSTSNTLIVGNNGSGKSTMLDALCFALFGKAFRNINKPNLVNSINSKDTVVEVEFDTNGKSYKIVRGIKPNVFEIYQDAVLLNQDAAVRDYQDYLEKFILKLNYKSFTQIVILGSASFTPFMQLSAADRRAIIEDLLDIQIFSVMNGLVKERLANNKDLTIAKKNEISLLEQKYELKKEHQDKLTQDNEEKVKEYEKEILLHRETIRTLCGEIDDLEQSKKTLAEICAKIPENEKKIAAFTKVESQIESKISKVGNDRSFYEHNADCPTCRQAITLEFKEGQLTELGTKEQELSHGLIELQTKITEQENIIAELREKEKELSNVRVQIATTNTSVKGLNDTIKRLEKEIKELRTPKVNDTDTNELETIQTQIKEAQEELKQ